jgi:hypothetical protein
MTREFDRVRASFASSWAGRALAGLERVATSAWRTSRFGAAMTGIAPELANRPAPILIRIAAIALAVAAALQPLLAWLLPATIKPALPPYVFVVIVLLAAAAAWRPGEIANAWPASRLVRALRR